MARFAALTAAFFTGALLFQQAQQPTFRARTDLVQWDVSVFDRDGRPVTGLPASAFTVLEDDAVRPIIGFSEITIPPARLTYAVPITPSFFAREEHHEAKSPAVRSSTASADPSSTCASAGDVTASTARSAPRKKEVEASHMAQPRVQASCLVDLLGAAGPRACRSVPSPDRPRAPASGRSSTHCYS